MLPRNHLDRIQVSFDVTVQTGSNPSEGHE